MMFRLTHGWTGRLSHSPSSRGNRDNDLIAVLSESGICWLCPVRAISFHEMFDHAKSELSMRRRSLLALGSGVCAIVLSSCGGGSAPIAAKAQPTTTTSTQSVPTTTVPPTTTTAPPATTIPTTTTSTTAKAPSSEMVTAEELNFIVGYVMAGYCTPNGDINQCEVAVNKNPGVAAPLAPSSTQSVGYDLCSADATSSNFYCSQNDSEGVLDAQAFPTDAAASSYLGSQQGQQWETGWQFNNWAILVASAGPGLPSSELDKIEKSLASAAEIYNGQPFYNNPLLMNLTKDF